MPQSFFTSLLNRKNLIHGMRMILALMALLGIVATAWAASDPWKDKEYKSWTQDDVERILYESPWVKMVEVDAPWMKGGMQYLTPMPTDCDGRPDLSKGNHTPMSWTLGDRESIVIFQVTWQSARTVRAARLRQALLCGRGDAERGAEMLDEQPDDYIITVHSPDMTPFKGMDEAALIKATSLSSKKGQKISPESVAIARYNPAGAPYMLTFKFPRKTESGEPVIAKDQKDIQFLSHFGKFTLKAKFQLEKMTTKDGQDL